MKVRNLPLNYSVVCYQNGLGFTIQLRQHGQYAGKSFFRFQYSEAQKVFNQLYYSMKKMLEPVNS